ncbi:MAG: oxygen-dependent coproporphyrinogen oxidase [Alphaproteobacteria bacterium]|nr:oxygen-dependent coproporphyrinogen oxidase [Alphaproteobacteria bacterium]
MNLDQQKQHAQQWFESLRNDICSEFERIEDELTGSSQPSGRFTRTNWEREGGGGGTMAVMKGRVFEKVGVNVSAVHGEFTDNFRKEVPGALEDPRFFATGVSLVAHMCSPHVPAVHMNTRFICTSKSWFGGGTDLTPIFPNTQDTDDFHHALKQACDAYSPEYYPQFKKECDEYFFLKHRNEPRGIGGIFFDYLNTDNWDVDFSFVQKVGMTFLHIYPQLVRRHMFSPWSNSEREAQLIKRGRYVEFNLLYDRGTRFGLMTGGNVEAILMSLPPEVRWP